MTLDRERATAILEHRQWGVEALALSTLSTVEATSALASAQVELAVALAHRAAVLAVRGALHLAASALLASTGGR